MYMNYRDSILNIEYRVTNKNMYMHMNHGNGLEHYSNYRYHNYACLEYIPLTSSIFPDLDNDFLGMRSFVKKHKLCRR